MNQIKILIVDDMRIIIELVASLLDDLNENFTILKASNGKEACRMAQTHKPDLIIMDWEMPEMSGFDALIKIKKNESTKDIPIIISSGFSESENIKLALEAGAIDYIRKPIDGIELIARVRSVLTLSSTYNKLKEQSVLLNQERQRTENILRGYLPDNLANEILHHGFSKPKRYKNVSILFADLVDFTSNTNLMSPKKMFDELNDIFPAFDDIMSFHNCIKIKTIGDAYLSACGMGDGNEDHAVKLASAAIDMRNYINYRNSISSQKWEIRIGINSGDIFGGLIGKNYYHFDIFGDTINTAARMQQNSEPMQINLSYDTNQQIQKSFKTIERLPIKVKGKGVQKMYFLHTPIVDDLVYDSFKEHPLKKVLFP
ncbi:MAG: response regulator [Marinilabiliaceae bacterium]|nr:response regulator [Marinilabiliaceae bacterium]